MRIAEFCFIVAGLSALTGMGMGMYMGMAEDFTLTPSHVHLNLLGWVTMALYGLYHRGVGRTTGLAGWLQVGSSALGAVVMALGLALYLGLHDERFVPMVIGGSLAAMLGMLMFLILLLHDFRARRRAGVTTAAQSG